MPARGAPPKKAKARSWASKTISRVSRGKAATNMRRLWHSRKCATLTACTTPPRTTTSQLQPNGYLAPGRNDSGTNAWASDGLFSAFQCLTNRRTLS